MSTIATLVVPSEPKGGFPPEVLTIADRLGVRHLLARVYGEIERLVSEPVDVQVEWDPEIEDCPKIAFTVRSSLNWETCLERERIRIERLLNFAGPDALHFVLLIYPRS